MADSRYTTEQGAITRSRAKLAAEGNGYVTPLHNVKAIDKDTKVTTDDLPVGIVSHDVNLVSDFKTKLSILRIDEEDKIQAEGNDTTDIKPL